MLLLLVAAAAMFVWYALLGAEVITWGTGAVVLGLGLAAFAAAFIPWWGTTYPWRRP